MAQSFATRSNLTPGQARTVAAWRFDDARRLWQSGMAKHMNGAVYLGGLALDCLLKARLLEKHPALRSTLPENLAQRERARWNLVYRTHDLEAIVGELPDVTRRLQDASVFGAPRLDTMLKSACSRWSIHVRYLPKRVDAAEADEFLRQVEELRRWL
ncbi:MAG TPA: hypothetical protein PKE29_07430 [Phycisphaerales bacterium]|nr:hypothetical protein [Phycisphaerales bacterium]